MRQFRCKLMGRPPRSPRQDAMHRLHLPIHEPCHENWDAMDQESDARRFCDVCTKQVHDLSSMTERQARKVLKVESAKGRVCVRYRTQRDGGILFRTETTAAPSLWQATLAAASMALVMLTGCADVEPTEILDDKCVYERGPLSFELARGQGTCPAAEEHELMGDVAVPEEVMGKIAVDPEPTDPEPEPVMGEAPAEEPCDSSDKPEDPEVQGEIEMMGDVAYEPDPPEPKPEKHPVKMGKIAAPVDHDEPADPDASKLEFAPDPDGPRRL